MWQSLQTSPTKGSLQAFIIILVVAVMREGVMRWDDVSRVTFWDVFITEQYARVFVNERKTDYKREGFWAMIPRRSEAWSAYQLLRQVAARFAGEFAKLSLAQRGGWLVGHVNLSHWEHGIGAVALNPVRVTCLLEPQYGAVLPVGADVGMTYNQFQDRFRAFLQQVGENPVGYSTHSMRRGGASEMRQRGLPDDVIAQHGGWKSKSSMHAYFDGTIEFSRRSALVDQAAEAHRLAGIDVSDVAALEGS
jgi:hypothetical protein